MAEIYQGLAAGAVEELIYGKLEPALVHFHRSLNRLLSESGSDQSLGTISRASSSACSS